MDIEKEWMSSRDYFIQRLKNGDFNFDFEDFENIKSHAFIKTSDEWFDYYYNPFTGKKKRVLDKGDFYFEDRWYKWKLNTLVKIAYS